MTNYSLPSKIWILIDLDNGDESTKRYLWWFNTKRAALEFKLHHEDLYCPHKTKLVGPYLFKSD